MCMCEQFVCVCVCVCIPVLVMFHEINFLTSLAAGKTIKNEPTMYTCITLLKSI